MDQLWAPWRLSYVAAAKAPADDEDCFICRGLAGDDDRGNLIALRTPRSVVVLNRFPYNNGHLLIAPRAHKGRLDDLGTDELLDVRLGPLRVPRQWIRAAFARGGRLLALGNGGSATDATDRWIRSKRLF
jgi:hypothetical protein